VQYGFTGILKELCMTKFILCILLFPLSSYALTVSPPLRYLGLHPSPALKAADAVPEFLGRVIVTKALPNERLVGPGGVKKFANIDGEMIFTSNKIPQLAEDQIGAITLRPMSNFIPGYTFPLDSLHVVLMEGSRNTWAGRWPYPNHEQLFFNSETSLTEYLNELAERGIKDTVIEFSLVSGMRLSLYFSSHESLKEFMGLSRQPISKPGIGKRLCATILRKSIDSEFKEPFRPSLMIWP
jgi:hypothetical protein